MIMRQIRKDIYAVGAIDWDARLFDRLIPLPHGTSYNSYVVRGSEKTALLDTVDPRKTEVLLDNLLKLGVDKIDYVVSHHAEQDHSGSIADVLLMFPEAKVVTNPKCKEMLMEMVGLEEDSAITIEDGEELSLGDKTLRFVYTPWVHWPETMSTYVPEEKVLFSCDFFGAHLATSSLFVDDEAEVYQSAKRYYAEIMMPFRTQIKSNITKVSELDIDIIAPSHGPVHDRPSLIVDAYKDWISDDVKNEVVVAYVSMHGSTEKMVAYFVDALMDRGIKVRQFELASADIGDLAMAMVDAATIVLGSPTVIVGPHPAAAYTAFLANILRPKTKFASVIGSYGWAGKMIDQLTALMPRLKADVLEPVLAKGHPGDEEFAALDRLADDVLARHKEIGITE